VYGLAVPTNAEGIGLAACCGVKRHSPDAEGLQGHICMLSGVGVLENPIDLLDLPALRLAAVEFEDIPYPRNLSLPARLAKQLCSCVVMNQNQYHRLAKGFGGTAYRSCKRGLPKCQM
jgi:hypothetical protein